MLDSLEGVESGKYIVTTQNGTQQHMDFDANTLVRVPAGAARAWDANGIGFGAVTADGEVFHWMDIRNAEVGKRMFLQNISEWRLTSVIVSIEEVTE